MQNHREHEKIEAEKPHRRCERKKGGINKHTRGEFAQTNAANCTMKKHEAYPQNTTKKRSTLHVGFVFCNYYPNHLYIPAAVFFILLKLIFNTLYNAFHMSARTILLIIR